MPDIFNSSEDTTTSPDTTKKDLKELFQKNNPSKEPIHQQVHPPSSGVPVKEIVNHEMPEPSEEQLAHAQKEKPRMISTEPSDDPNLIKPTELKAAAEKTMEQPPAVDDLPEHLRKKPGAIGLFSHYRPNPTGITFVNQERDEKVVLFLRRHFFTNIPWIASTLLLMLLPIITYLLFRLVNLTLFAIPTDLMIIMLCFYYLVILNYALMKFIEWFFHVGVVTKKRMLDLDVDNILHHHMAETNIDEIVDVSYSQTGFLQSFFNYGNVHIQTEALKANFEFEMSPKPSTVSDILTDLRQIVLSHEKGGKQHA